jgi:carboxyl-terminal processing protease
LNKKISIATVIVLIALSVLITYQLTYIKVDNKYNIALSEIKDHQLVYEKLAEVDEVYRKQYIGQIDDSVLIDTMIKGYVEGTGDTYGEYYTKQEYEELLRGNNSEYVGIGIQYIYNETEDAIEVVEVIQNSSAEEAGIMIGDMIVRVGDKTVKELGFDGALSEIRGEEKTFADITIERKDELTELHIERRKVTDYTVFPRLYTADNSIGIIRITEFGSDTVQQFKNAVKGLLEKGADKLVLDVRNNLGGDLGAICEILDYLVPKGTLVRIYDKSGRVSALESDASSVELPMVVITNRYTSGVAELFACTLRDHNKAVLVGEKTYGKGSMQTILPFDNGTALRVTTSLYAPPVTENYDGIGIEPDVQISLPEELRTKSIYLLTDEEDTQLTAAVKTFDKTN